MDHDRKNQDQDTGKDEHVMKFFDKRGEDQKDSSMWKYIKVTLIILIIIVGINKYVFPIAAGASGFFSNTRSQIALDYYIDQYGYEGNPEDITSRFRKFGCHDEIQIYINGELVKKLTYVNGKVYEIE